jgi:hypothetical protein
MIGGLKHRVVRLAGSAIGAFVLCGLAGLGGPIGTAAAEPPAIVSTVVDEVTATGTTLHGSINPHGMATTYRFEYLTTSAYEGNLGAGRAPFFGALLAPSSGTKPVGSGSSALPVGEHLSGLTAATAYRYRLRATNSASESVVSLDHPFATRDPTNVFELLDHRGWELVPPLDKAGGAVQPPGAISGGGVFQAAAAGGSATFSSVDSFGAADGAPAGNQYLAARESVGWTIGNVSPPLLSGSYGSQPDGVPYQLFSADLRLGLLSNGERCRGRAGGECPVANPPLPESGAPAGYRDYYLRSASGAFTSLLTRADVEHSALGPAQFELRLLAATPDLSHVVLSSCAALTANATEVAAAGGCDPAAQNLYEWSSGSGLSLVNLLPGASVGTPGTQLAAPLGALSRNGSRVYFRSGETVYLREAGVTKTVLDGPGAEFVTASSASGQTAYLIKAGKLLSYSAPTGTVTQLTGGSGVEGVLGTSADGSKVYYAEGGTVFLRSGATTTQVASSALPSDWQATGRTARVSADGAHLLFLSTAELAGYPNEGQTEVFLYGPTAGSIGAQLTCVSCNPTGERPQGIAAIPGVDRNGSGVEAFAAYEPRALSADGQRVFFETSDSLVAHDTNGGAVDVYEWEAAGEGTCVRSGGCVQLISGGRDPEPSYFLDADERGSEAFFLTAESLYPLDPGSYDVYVAREGGGFAIPESPIPCVADACQVLPEAPEDPGPGTLVSNSGNPALKVSGESNGKNRKKHPHKKKSKKKKKHHRGPKK